MGPLSPALAYSPQSAFNCSLVASAMNRRSAARKRDIHLRRYGLPSPLPSCRLAANPIVSLSAIGVGCARRCNGREGAA